MEVMICIGVRMLGPDWDGTLWVCRVGWRYQGSRKIPS